MYRCTEWLPRMATIVAYLCVEMGGCGQCCMPSCADSDTAPQGRPHLDGRAVVANAPLVAADDDDIFGGVGSDYQLPERRTGHIPPYLHIASSLSMISEVWFV